MRKNNANWIRHTHLFHEDEYECSACGFRTDKAYKMCPHCGLPMKGSKTDPSWVDEMVLIDTILDD